jgi:hypothetical protein
MCRDMPVIPVNKAEEEERVADPLKILVISTKKAAFMNKSDHNILFKKEGPNCIK